MLILASPILLLIALDDTDSPEQEFQRTLLKRVFARMAPELMENIPLDLAPKNIHHVQTTLHGCLETYHTVELRFKKSLLRKFRMIQWQTLNNLAIEFLPHSIEDLNVVHCNQAYQVHTRRLPRHAHRINMSGNRLTASIDLTQLPPRLLLLDLSNNYIGGPISFSKLPKTILRINLTHNSNLVKPVVYYGALPASLLRIDLQHTGIRRVKPVQKQFYMQEKFLLSK